MVDVLEGLGASYAIGGSVASALYGVMLATMDVDLVASLRLQNVASFVQALGRAFFGDAEMMREAIEQQGSFNLIHLDSMSNVDVFNARSGGLGRAQLECRELHLLAEDPERRACVLTAEDTVLAKLDGYRKSGETSDRRLRDVLGVLKVQGPRLNFAHIREMAAELSVQDLLARALQEPA